MDNQTGLQRLHKEFTVISGVEDRCRVTRLMEIGSYSEGQVTIHCEPDSSAMGFELTGYADNETN